MSSSAIIKYSSQCRRPLAMLQPASIMSVPLLYLPISDRYTCTPHIKRCTGMAFTEVLGDTKE